MDIFPSEEIAMIYVLKNSKHERIKVFGKEDKVKLAIFPDLRISLADAFPVQI